MAEYSASQITIANGSKAVVINSGESPENVRQGDFLFVTGSDPVAINRTYINDDNKHVIELTKNWGQGNKNNQPAIVLPSTAEYKTVADALKNANLLVNDNFVAMQDWQTKTGTVTFVNIDGTTTTVKTLKQIESEAQAQLDAYHPYPWAMRKGEFEAIRKNNRLKYAASGFVHFGLHSGKDNSINEGLQVYSSLTSASQKHNFLAGRSRAESSYAESLTESPILNILGVEVEFNLDSSADYHKTVIRLPKQENGTRTYDSATGTSVTHATPAIAFASETETNKVVYERYDLWGVEVFLREVSETDPWVYKFGCIQNRSSSIESVGTKDVTEKPTSYFAWYLGDTATIGRGVNWFEATESEKAQIAANPKHNIYFDDLTGKFYQWCARGRSVAGAGNGQWAVLESHGTSPLRFDIGQRVKPQGKQEAIPTALGKYNDPVYGWFVGVNSDENKYTAKKDIYDLGVFSSVRTNSNGTGLSAESNENDYYAINSDCHFLVCGTVERLNEGSFHPAYNPKGTRPWRYNPNYFSYVGKWYQGGHLNVNNNLMCFELLTQADQKIGASAYGGDIESGPLNSGRPDQRFYDGVYASGAGGISRDMRYSAWGVSDLNEKAFKIKNGEYRGREKELFTKVVKITPENAQNGKLLWTGTDNTTPSSSMGWISLGTSKDNLSLAIGSKIYAFDSATGESWSGRIANFETTSSSIFCRVMFDNWTPSVNPVASDTTYAIYSQSFGTETAGVYEHVDVIGNPANIINCQDIGEGWYGHFLPELPDGTEKKYILNKPLIGSNVTVVYTENLGDNWVVESGSSGVNVTENSKQTAWPENCVILCSYQTSANYTVEANNAIVLGGTSGLGAVYMASRGNTNTSGRFLGASLIGKALNGANGIREEYTPLKSYGFRTDMESLSSGYPTLPPSHENIRLDGAEGIVAYKCIDYLTQKDGQAFIQYTFSQLVYDPESSSWGDDLKFSIVDDIQIGVDDNNQPIVFGTHCLVDPIGWIRNDK